MVPLHGPERIVCRSAAFSDMSAHQTSSPDPARLALTESALAAADLRWRAEMRRNYGPEGVLTFAFLPEAQGGLGTPLRRTYEARRIAVALWRHERRRG